MVTILDVGDDNGNESLTVYVVNYVDDRSATHMLCWPLIFDFIFVILNAFFHKKSWIIVSSHPHILLTGASPTF